MSPTGGGRLNSQVPATEVLVRLGKAEAALAEGQWGEVRLRTAQLALQAGTENPPLRHPPRWPSDPRVS